ncbi:MAG: ETC complex I subunit [Alphaproteobacteria bacterium]
MRAKIYRPAKTAMQSGTRNTKKWLLEFERAVPRRVDSLMGWSGSTDTSRQVRLSFDSKDEAIGYAARNGLDYVVQEPRQRVRNLKSYADNFRYDTPEQAD